MKKIAIFIILIACIFSFWKINEENYVFHRKIRFTIVNHPESMPTKETAKNTSFGFKNLKADLYWIEAIQYIGGNVIKAEYKKYLFSIIDIITELNPYFEHPYKLGLLLLPDYNDRYENLTKAEIETNLRQAETIGLKGIKNFCDAKKIEAIKKEYDLKKIWTDPMYKDPCLSFDIPYYLAFIYHFYLNNPSEAANYYKIASAKSNSLAGAKILAAIMVGKGGNREKSYFMFLNMAKNVIEKEKQYCINFAGELERIGSASFLKQIDLNGKLLSEIEKSREKIIGKFDEKQEKTVLNDNECTNFINKAVRELNLYYLESANEKYKKDHNQKSAKNAKVLFDNKYIDYLPRDFQKYGEYEIIYEFSKDTGYFDYNMGKADYSM